MPPPTVDEILKEWWGWDDTVGSEFRAPLPVTPRFGFCGRPGGGICPIVNMPPYFLARRFRDHMDVMLCDGSGKRARYYEGSDAEQHLYVGTDQVPYEWREPIASALNEIGRRWPGVPLLFRPEPDVDEKVLGAADA